jgi:hypothetical protein
MQVFCRSSVEERHLSVASSLGRLRGLYSAAYMAIMNVTGGAFGAVLVGLLTDHWLGAAHLRRPSLAALAPA